MPTCSPARPRWARPRWRGLRAGVGVRAWGRRPCVGGQLPDLPARRRRSLSRRALVIQAEKNTIQIEQVRNLQTDAAIAPLEGKRKVFIIREIERATPPAANALLKTLEEPPSHVVLLLTSNRRDQVLPTVLSRCQIIGLRTLPSADRLQAALRRVGRGRGAGARLLARLSGGRLAGQLTRPRPLICGTAGQASR